MGRTTSTSGGRAARAARAATVAAALVVCLAPAASAGTVRLGAVEEIVGRPYQKLIEEVAGRHNLDSELFAALVEVESARNPKAVSPKGARGLGQLMPQTAKRFGVLDVHDPEDNLEGAAQYLAWLIDRYKGDLHLALAAYNAGEGAVDKYNDVPDYPETQDFVRKVLRRAGLSYNARHHRTGEAEPPRCIRMKDGKILLTNVP